MEAFFRKERARIATFVSEHYEPKKAAGDFLDDLDLTNWSKLTAQFNKQLDAVVKESSTKALAEIGVDDKQLFDLVQEDALAWAKDRAAEMVGMRYNAAGELVENPDAKWAITETTRDGLRSMIESAYENGIDVDTLAEKIEESYLFSGARAEMIARTELAKADTQATLISWKESGLVAGKRSLLGSEHDEEAFDCDCAEIEDEGVIGLDDLFLGEYDAPPYHPNCVCVLVTNLLEDSGDSDVEE